jgi:glycerol uptake facilitator-like aquaporin
MIGRRMSFTRGMLYMVAQCVGAAAAALVLTLVIPAGTHGNLGASGLGPGVSLGGGLLTEIIVSFLLVSTMLATVLNPARPGALGLAAVGLACVVAHLFAGPLTGASMNPARSFGPAFVIGAWKSQWIFWMGPLMGAAIAACVHELFSARDRR